MLDAVVDLMFPGWASVSGSAALFAIGSSFPWRPPTPAPSDVVPGIRAARFQITGLDAVFGAAPLAAVSFPGTQGGSLAWSATPNPECERQWTSRDATLRVGFSSRTSFGGGYGFRVAFSPVATLLFDHPMTLRRMLDDWVVPLLRIVSISIGKPQSLTHLDIDLNEPLDPQASEKAQVFGTGISQEPIDCDLDPARRRRSSLLAAADGVSLLSMVTEWQRLAAEHHPLIETYGAMLHSDDEHPRSRLLLLLQSLEGLHGAETRSEYEARKSQHGSNRERILQQARTRFEKEDLKFLKENLNKEPRSGLESALRAVLRGLPVDLTEDLRGTRLVSSAALRDSGGPENVLRIVRNDLAHGRRGYEPADLQEVVRILERVVQAHALRLLGCNTQIQTRALERRR